MSVTGNLVYIREFPAMQSAKETIDLQHVSKGIYFLRLKEKDTIRTIKLIFR